MDYILVLVVGLFAGTLGGVVGTGSSLVMMPILVVMHGPRQAVPIMAVAAIMGNMGRVLAWRREIDWRACGAYCLTAVPGAMLGARLLLSIPPGVAETALGIFFLVLIPARRWLARREFRISTTHLMLLGAPLGILRRIDIGDVSGNRVHAVPLGDQAAGADIKRSKHISLLSGAVVFTGVR